ncbi:transcriptional regulator, Crp/Fnr family [Loktanella fryxellensis]|uniref:Transcriptional regulator, Crp/Fnr family n=1 Tax=Loktanella fryxellensis TaxID=245187 RepID=A0A1H8K6T1_9RHOB|nr:Crp/Fnr family transcriptional regulator [Loktanella fryxellensis]SEN88673.1 transcriptional regulator, Crp/Fnr family [Loktanella fryxellensis]
MMKDQTIHANELLGAFTKEAYSRIAPFLTEVDLDLGTVVCEAGGLLSHAYFPQGCVLSLLTVLENGSEIECANIGREGAFGLFAAMYSRVSFNRCTVQLQGPMVRCDIRPLQAMFESSAHMQNLFVSYSETLLSQVMQTVACNSLHSVEERLCRWLLMMHDRAEGENLTYTHEFLARIMGVNRTSVTLAAQSLQSKGLIRYRRGMMQVVDRRGMETAACECYMVVRERFDAFLNPPSTAIQKTEEGGI